MNTNDGGPDAPVVFATADGRTACVSLDDAPLVSSRRWRFGSNGYVYVVGGRAAGVQCLLHRMITGAGAGDEVHHVNGDKADNRRSNLVIVTASAHQHFHRHAIVARNVASRIYDTRGTCGECGREFTKDASHRGRQRLCSKACAIARLIRARADAMLRAREAGR